MTPEEAYKGYREGVAAFKAAGIPWNKKGSPHRLLLKAKSCLQFIPMIQMVQFTFRENAPRLAANITANNALLSRLMANSSHG